MGGPPSNWWSGFAVRSLDIGDLMRKGANTLASKGLSFDDQGRVSLIRCSDGGDWAMPGGAMTTGERMAHCAETASPWRPPSSLAVQGSGRSSGWGTAASSEGLAAQPSGSSSPAVISGVSGAVSPSATTARAWRSTGRISTSFLFGLIPSLVMSRAAGRRRPSSEAIVAL